MNRFWQTKRNDLSEDQEVLHFPSMAIMVIGHAAEYIWIPQRKMAVFFFIVKCILRNAFPTFNIMLVQHISFQHGFAKENGNNQENKDGNKMGNIFFTRSFFIHYCFRKACHRERWFQFQADKIMLFYTKITHALAIIFVKTGFYLWVLFSSFFDFALVAMDQMMKPSLPRLLLLVL